MLPRTLVEAEFEEPPHVRVVVAELIPENCLRIGGVQEQGYGDDPISRLICSTGKRAVADESRVFHTDRDTEFRRLRESHDVIAGSSKLKEIDEPLGGNILTGYVGRNDAGATD